MGGYDFAIGIVAYLSNSLLPGMLLALLICGVFWIYRKLNASTKYAVWSGALIVVVFLPLFVGFSIPTNLGILSEPEAPIRITVVDDVENQGLFSTPQILIEPPNVAPAGPGYFPTVEGYNGYKAALVQSSNGQTWNLPNLVGLILFGLWTLGVGIGIIPLVRSLIYLTQLKRQAQPLKTLQEHLDGWMAQHQIRRRIQLRASSNVNVPMSLGFIRSVILMPDFLLDQLTPAEIDQVLLHEIAHIKRHDDWTKLIQKLIRVFFFFHPAVWWIDRQLDFEREIACDDWVAQATNQRQGYANCLLRLLEIGLHHPKMPVQLGLMMASRIESRIRKLIDQKRSISTNIPKLKLMFGFCTLLIFSAVSINFFPEITVSANMSQFGNFANSFEFSRGGLEIASGTELVIELPLESMDSFQTNSDTTTLRVKNLIAVFMNQYVRFEFENEKLLAKVLLLENTASFSFNGVREIDLQNPTQPEVNETIKAIRTFSIKDIALRGHFKISTGPSLDETVDLVENPTTQIAGTILIQPLVGNFEAPVNP